MSEASEMLYTYLDELEIKTAEIDQESWFIEKGAEYWERRVYLAFVDLVLRELASGRKLTEIEFTTGTKPSVPLHMGWSQWLQEWDLVLEVIVEIVCLSRWIMRESWIGKVEECMFVDDWDVSNGRNI